MSGSKPDLMSAPVFRRGLDDRFIDDLAQLASTQSWWSDVLADRTLFIGIRDQYLNVYWQGQSIFRISRTNNRVLATTHPKYLFNPSVSGQVSLVGGKRFDFASFKQDMLTSDYESGETLSRLKRAASLYAGDEKRGVHQIIASNDHVVDVEIALSSNAALGGPDLPRIDLAAFERKGNAIKLVFWEAKTFYNPELRSAVIRQIDRYRSVLSAQRRNLEKSYAQVAKNLKAIAEMSSGHREASELVLDVARIGSVIIDEPPDVGLLVYGFDAAQRDGVWEGLRKNLVEALGADYVRAKGDPKGFRI